MKRDDTDRLVVYFQRIRDCYPDLEARTTHLTDGGEFNDILIVNDELIFRFPRFSDGLERLRVEVATLGAIQGCVSLPVPNPVYVSQDMQTVDVAFLGYHVLSGELLRDHLETARAKAARQQLARQLATFLLELHRFPTKAVKSKVPMHDCDRREALPVLFESIREHLYPHMRPDACDAVTNQFDVFLNAPTSFGYEQVLKHGDLGPGNILVDPQTLTITGIIDFGSAGLDDPAVDLGHISFWGESLLGKPFVRQLYDDYGMSELLLSRVRFYKVMIALMVALGGVQSGDREAFELALGQFM